MSVHLFPIMHLYALQFYHVGFLKRMHSNCGLWQNLTVLTASCRTSLKELVYSAQQVTHNYHCRALPLAMDGANVLTWAEGPCFCQSLLKCDQNRYWYLYQFNSIIYSKIIHQFQNGFFYYLVRQRLAEQKFILYFHVKLEQEVQNSEVCHPRCVFKL